MKTEDNIYFCIGEVAAKIGVVPATIRNWEKQGLYTSKRSPNGYRIYDFKDIEFLKEVKRCSKDENMGMNAIRMLQNPSLKNQTSITNSVSKRLLSEKWKEYRLAHGYGLNEVAAKVGISPSYLSKIENGIANVSLKILESLAKFYGESLMHYVGQSDKESHIVKRAKGEKFTIGLDGVTVESLVELKESNLSTMIYTVEPGSGSAETTTHSGEEYLYLLSGKVLFMLGDDEFYELNTGDSLCYPSNKPHSWKNTGDTTAQILWVYTRIPRTF